MKVDLFIYSWVLSHFVLIVRSSGQTVHNTLKCYQCEIEGKDPNHTCKEDDLKICPNDYAADRCLTSIKKNLTGHYLITKRCALAPCDLPGIQSSLLKLTGNCDTTRDEFNCYFCCATDGCNLHSSANGIHRNQQTLLSRIIFIWHITPFLPLCFNLIAFATSVLKSII